MTPLLTTAECRYLVKTSKTETELTAIIARIEAMIANKIGAYQDETGNVTITETVKGKGYHLFLKVPFSSVVSISEDGATVDTDDYQEWGSSGMIERLPECTEWGDECVVVYKPIDQRYERKQATTELVRLFIERTAMVSENIAGEYSFNSPDWDKAIKRELKNLCFTEV